jgi:asparagine synthetase B (glutamine-hydrolysing)
VCSFIFSTKYAGQDIADLNKYLKFRGPDHTQVLQREGILFVHNLLHLTGEYRIQPIVDNGVVLMYNGEIYNYKDFGDYKSDGDCLIPLYRQYGEKFPTMLDGEFTICLVDFEKKIIILSSDIFKTKPMFVSINGPEIGCAGYRSALDKLGHTKIVKATPNATYVISTTDGSYHWNPVYNWDLRQHKNTYDDWVAAWKQSVEKRIRNTEQKIFIGLSSGYDSGAIYSELLRLGIDFTTISLTGTENNEVMMGRFLRSTDKVNMIACGKSPSESNVSLVDLAERTEPFQFTIKTDKGKYNEFNTWLSSEGGAIHFATVCRMARKEGCKICLSGTGADEIISDYGFGGKAIYQHSNFGGLFPDDLNSIFPWGSFYGSTMESYIAKEEYTGGMYGIEMRYPFLDRKLVQEFLFLTPQLKNRVYKAPIDHYLTISDMPFINEKRGF